MFTPVTSRDSVVLRHAFFSGASSRLPSGHVMHHLATIYIVRSVDLWKTEEVREKIEKRMVEQFFGFLKT